MKERRKGKDMVSEAEIVVQNRLKWRVFCDCPKRHVALKEEEGNMAQ